MIKVSFGVAPSTITFWKRRSRAPSFSIFSLYSSRVVAPIHWSSPLANAGLKILDASKEPDELPAPIEVISNDTILLSHRFWGQSPSKIFIAKPSTMAVLPAPGSPIIIGLFFFRLESIWAILLISFSRPTTGSSLPCSACLIRSREKLSKTGVLELLISLGFLAPLSFGSTSSIIFFLLINRYKYNKNIEYIKYLTFCHTKFILTVILT